jgi:hypothetical protein
MVNEKHIILTEKDRMMKKQNSMGKETQNT